MLRIGINKWLNGKSQCRKSLHTVVLYRFKRQEKKVKCQRRQKNIGQMIRQVVLKVEIQVKQLLMQV